MAEAAPEGYYQWFTPKEDYLLGYMADEKVFVLLNAGAKEGDFKDIELPAGNWKLIGNNTGVDHTNGVKAANKQLQTLKGGAAMGFSVPAASLYIWVKQ